jgi:hypothetical protein
MQNQGLPAIGSIARFEREQGLPLIGIVTGHVRFAHEDSPRAFNVLTQDGTGETISTENIARISEANLSKKVRDALLSIHHWRTSASKPYLQKIGALEEERRELTKALDAEILAWEHKMDDAKEAAGAHDPEQTLKKARGLLSEEEFVARVIELIREGDPTFEANTPRPYYRHRSNRNEWDVRIDRDKNNKRIVTINRHCAIATNWKGALPETLRKEGRMHLVDEQELPDELREAYRDTYRDLRIQADVRRYTYLSLDRDAIILHQYTDTEPMDDDADLTTQLAKRIICNREPTDDETSQAAEHETTGTRQDTHASDGQPASNGQPASDEQQTTKLAMRVTITLTRRTKDWLEDVTRDDRQAAAILQKMTVDAIGNDVVLTANGLVPDEVKTIRAMLDRIADDERDFDARFTHHRQGRRQKETLVIHCGDE